MCLCWKQEQAAQTLLPAILREMFSLNAQCRLCTTGKIKLATFASIDLFHIQLLFKIKEAQITSVVEFFHLITSAIVAPSFPSQASVLNVLYQTLDSWRKEARCAGKL